VIAKGAFNAQVVVVDVAFEHELGVGGNLEIDGLAARHAHAAPPQETGERDLVDDRGQRRGGGIRDRRVGADRDGDRNVTAPFLGVRAALFVLLPVHSKRVAIEALQTVHADVLRSAAGVAREDQRQRDERPAVERPGRQDRELGEIDVVLDDFVHGCVFDHRGNRECRRTQRKQLGQPAFHRMRHAELDDVANALPQFVERTRAEGHGHPAFGAELIGEHRILRSGDVGEEQGGAARLDHAVADLGDFQVGVDPGSHLGELAGAA